MFRPEQMGVYIHWPFCNSRCPYCDFNTYVRKQDFDEKLWADAYLGALDYYAQIVPDKQVVSIFFGGGTPSLMSPDLVGRMIDRVRASWDTVKDVEITLEANPTSVENSKLREFAQAGVNRLSLGVQSLTDEGIKFLGREHSVREALEALDLARKHFSRFSFDLIYARQGQDLSDWEDELREALAVDASHMSLYQLTIAEGTPFYRNVEACDEAKGTAFYNLTQDVMEEAGLPAYEVSNHARVGEECRHNLVYWHMADYIGIGAGAHGRYMRDGNKYATRDVMKPKRWLERVSKDGHGAALEELSYEEQLYETLLMGLRLYEGVGLTRVKDILDFDKVTVAVREGWLVCDEHKIKATREGMLRLNALLGYIVS